MEYIDNMDEDIFSEVLNLYCPGENELNYETSLINLSVYTRHTKQLIVILIRRWCILFPRFDYIEISSGRQQHTSCKTNGYSGNMLIDVTITSCFEWRANISELCQIIHKWVATYENEIPIQ
jgi:hypothetical protein